MNRYQRIMKILDNIYLVPSHVNCYIIEREQECILIDTGMSKNAKCAAALLKSNFPDKPLKSVILTHCHIDHTAGIDIIRKYFDFTIIAHEEEKPYIEKEKELPRHKGISGFLTKMIGKIVGVSDLKVDQTVNDGEILYGLQVMHLPGHTPGTIALVDVENKALFCGDIVNGDHSGSKILPPKERFAVDYKQALEASVRMLEETSPSVILTGHGKPILEPKKAISAYLEEFRT